MTEELTLAERVLDVAGADGGEVEVYVQHRLVTTVQAGTGGELRQVGRAETRGIGIRAVLADRVGYASTADTTDDGIRSAVGRARANAASAEADPAGARLPDAQELSPLDGLCHPALSTMSLNAKIALVRELARRVISLDARVRGIDTAQWRDERSVVAVASTRGVRGTYARGFADLWSDALGHDRWGTASDFGYWWGRDPEAADPGLIAAEAVRRTTNLLGPAHAVPADVGSLLLDPVVSAVVLDAIGRALTGGALQSRRSPFASRSGQRIGSPNLDLVDDGRYLGAPGTAPFDDEGVSRRRTALIERGVLTGTPHSTATATASSAGSASTGNARRASHKGAPRAAPTTLRLASTESWGSVVGRLDEAVCVQQLAGSEVGISATTGRISVGGIAFRMRDGEPAGRLPTLPIASTVPELLAGLTGVGDDARVVLDRAALAPTLLWQR